METSHNSRKVLRDDSRPREVRQTGCCIAVVVIALFVAAFVAKWLGWLPSPLAQ